MKKQGFTLAEVLTTLMVIGVVAAMTIPTLMNSTKDQQDKVAYKKAMSVLGQAAQLLVAKEVECEVNDADDLASCFANNVLAGTRGLKTVDNQGDEHDNTNVVVTSDGMAYGFYVTDHATLTNQGTATLSDVCGASYSGNNTDDWDGSNAGCIVVVDTNGLNKGSKFFPEQAAPAAVVATDISDNVGQDKYPFILTGSGVTPIWVEAATGGSKKGYEWIYGGDAQPTELQNDPNQNQGQDPADPDPAS